MYISWKHGTIYKQLLLLLPSLLSFIDLLITSSAYQITSRSVIRPNCPVMPYFPPNTGLPLPGQLDEPSNDRGTPYDQPAAAPDLVRFPGLDTQPALSQIEMFNYLLRFHHSNTPAPFVGPAHIPPVQTPGLNSTNLGSLPQVVHSNGMAAGFNEPSMQSQIANLHGFNQALPDIDPPTQDPIPIPAQGLEPQPAPQTPQPAPRRCGRNARSRPRPYERR